MKKLSLAIIIIALSIYVISCKKTATVNTANIADLDFSTFPLKTISEYGIFKGDLKNLEVNSGFVYYEPEATLFTDYASKTRYVWMPKDSIATVNPDPTEPFEFPVNTILVKNFFYPKDPKNPKGEKRIVETRLLINTPTGWQAYPYVWSDDQKEAKYKVTGALKELSYSNLKGETHTIKYAVPNKNQCKSCHNQDDKFLPIGPKIKQLNHDLVYEDGTTMNQLEHWEKVGFLELPENLESFGKLVNMEDKDASLALKARSYLDVNCAHCHNKKGPASTSGLYLNIEENDPFHWGVFKSPVAAGIGAGPHKFSIYPGHGDESIIPFRMNSTNPGIMMPEIGRVSIDKEGVQLITKWINDMELKK